jgi:hypothetical protein
MAWHGVVLCVMVRCTDRLVCVLFAASILDVAGAVARCIDPTVSIHDLYHATTECVCWCIDWMMDSPNPIVVGCEWIDQSTAHRFGSHHLIFVD